MPIRSVPLLRSAALCAALLALSGCGRGDDNNLAAIDNALLANGADPALTSALEDQILVDPNLVQQAHPNTVRPPESPVQAQYPAGSARQASGAAGTAAGGGDCGGDFQYGRQWANRLPAGFTVYPGGQITDAAGNGAGNCRVVTFRTGDRFDRVLAYYRDAAARAGFSVEQQARGSDRVMGGVNADSDGAYYLIVTPQANGSEVALIVNNGR